MSSVSYDSEDLITLTPPLLEIAEIVPIEKGSYRQILKSSAVIGGSSILNIGIGIIRSKAMAVLLGPAGFGLFGLYGLIADLTQSVAGMGINSSGVRQIAEASSTGDTERIARTSAVLRRTSTALGIIGALLLIVFSKQISRLTFGGVQHASAICLLAIVVFFKLVSAGQGALIQGMRRIGDLAKMGVFGALFGTCVSIPMVYFFHANGVVPSLVAIATMSIVTSWWFSRKLYSHRPSMTFAQVGEGAIALLKLGFAFMASGLMTMGVAYLVRITVLHKVGLEATGLYQSAWTIGGLYVGFILQAMGADFYPRLTANANNNVECNRLVNEQALVGLLLAVPGVIGTLTFAPLVIALFYSAKFSAAVGILRWICLGVTLQIVTWPMGFIIVAKGKQNIFIFCELAWTIVAVALAWFCITSLDVAGAGVAFFLSYVFHLALIYPVVRHLSGFHWSAMNLRTGLFLFSAVAVVFILFYILPFVWSLILGTLAVVLTAAYSVRTLLIIVPVDDLPHRIRKPLMQLSLIFAKFTAIG
jgi:antigen flippase